MHNDNCILQLFTIVLARQTCTMTSERKRDRCPPKEQSSPCRHRLTSGWLSHRINSVLDGCALTHQSLIDLCLQTNANAGKGATRGALRNAATIGLLPERKAYLQAQRVKRTMKGPVVVELSPPHGPLGQSVKENKRPARPDIGEHCQQQYLPGPVIGKSALRDRQKSNRSQDWQRMSSGQTNQSYRILNYGQASLY